MSTVRWKKLGEKLDSTWQQWKWAHDGLLRVLDTFVNVLGRVEALQRPGWFSGLYQPEDTQRRVLDHQLDSLNTLTGALRDAVLQKAVLVGNFKKLAMEGKSLLSQSRSDTVKLARGAEPSLEQQSDMLQKVWQMCEEELELEQILVERIQSHWVMEQMSTVQALLSGSPCVDSLAVDRYLYQLKEVQERQVR